MRLPGYLMETCFRPKGTRLPKVVALSSRGGRIVVDSFGRPRICDICHEPIMEEKLGGSWQVQGIEREGKHYHYGACIGKAPVPRYQSMYYGDDDMADTSGFIRASALNETGEIIDVRETRRRRWHQHEQEEVPAGNLPESEYRYWIGNRAVAGGFNQFAQCRACRTTTYSPEERAAHKKDTQYHLLGNACTVQLVHCYKNLMHVSQCIVCKGHRKQSQGKWGAPVCGSPKCHIAWKFGFERWIPLETEMALLRARDRVEKEKESRKSKVPAIVSAAQMD